jgi:hypothetical protein
LDGVLPSEDTLLADRVMRHSPLLNEPGFTLDRFTRVREFYQQQQGYRLPLFHVCNDATVLRQQLTWRASDNAVHGLITLRDVRCPDSIAGIAQLVEQYGGIASEADVLLLCPYNGNVPPFPLAVFPQYHGVKAEAHMQRWALADHLLAEQGLFVCSHGCDGDSAHMKSFSILQPGCFMDGVNSANDNSQSDTAGFHHRTEPRTHRLWYDVTQLDGSKARVSAPARLVQLQLAEGQPAAWVLIPDLHFQDFAHEGLKCRSRLCGRDGHGVEIGNGRAEIKTLIDKIGDSVELLEVLHLRKGDLMPKVDPMNIASFWRLFSKEVILYLRTLVEDDDAAAAAAVAAAAVAANQASNQAPPPAAAANPVQQQQQMEKDASHFRAILVREAIRKEEFNKVTKAELMYVYYFL